MYVVRWLGAYDRRHQCLAAAFVHELTTQAREVAAQPYPRGCAGLGDVPSRVGLLLDGRDVRRHFPADVWSEQRPNSDRLRPTRRGVPAPGRHAEAFCVPNYRGIVVKEGLSRLEQWERESVLYVAQRFHLPVYRINYRQGSVYLREEDASRRSRLSFQESV